MGGGKTTAQRAMTRVRRRKSGKTTSTKAVPAPPKATAALPPEVSTALPVQEDSAEGQSSAELYA